MQRRGLGVTCSESQLRFTPCLERKYYSDRLHRLSSFPGVPWMLPTHTYTSLAPWHSGSATNVLLHDAGQLALSEVTSPSAEAS